MFQIFAQHVLYNFDDKDFSIPVFEDSSIIFDDYWEEWPFWNKFGPVKSILYNTESVDTFDLGNINDVNNNRQDYTEIEDTNEDEEGWTSWRFWQETGSVTDILFSLDQRR